MRDTRNRNGLTEDERRRVIGCAFSAAVAIAPFIALLYSREIGLVVLAAALGCTIYFAFEAYREAEADRRRQLMALLVVNAAFLTAVVIVLVWLVTG
jgi:hypothetical protein